MLIIAFLIGCSNPTNEEVILSSPPPNTVINSSLLSYNAIDVHMNSLPVKFQLSIDDLTNYINSHRLSDKFKARAIYAWIGQNIQYDASSYDKRVQLNDDAHTTFHNRKSVCTGVVNLVNKLCEDVGLESKTIKGYCKGVSFASHSDLSNSGHVWSAIKIDDKWELFDFTWAIGHCIKHRGITQCTPCYSDEWFMVDPYQFVFTHLPFTNKYTFVKEEVSKQTFKKIPHYTKNVFNSGIIAEEVLWDYLLDKNFSMAKVYPMKGVKLFSFPHRKNLKIGLNYVFEIEASEDFQFSLLNIDVNTTKKFVYEEDSFRLKYNPKVASKIAILATDNNNKSQYLLEYVVI